MNTLIKISLSISLVFLSPYGYADEVKDTQNQQCETQINCTVQSGNTTTTTTTPTTSSGGTTVNRGVSGLTTTTTTTDPNNYGLGSGGSGAYQQAQNAKNQANMTMIAAFAMAAMLAAMCNPPTNITPCILAPLAAMAGIMAGQKKDQAQNVMNSLGTSEHTQGTTDNSTTTDGSDAAAVQLAKIKADLAKKGVGMNADGSTTLPNGKTVASDLNRQSLQAAGLSGSEIDKLNSDLEKMKKDINDKAGGNGEGTGVASIDGAGAGGPTRISDDDYSGERRTASTNSEAETSELDKDPSKWGDFYKQYGDSQIGVAQSDIFLMVEKRVETERKVMGQ